MIRLIAFFRVPHREVLRRVRDAARALDELPSVASVSATRRVDAVGDRRAAGPVLELEFADEEAMRLTLASIEWNAVALAAEGGPMLHAYEVEPLGPNSAAE